MSNNFAVHGASLRRGRCSGVGGIYLVTTVIAGRRPLLRDWRAARLLVDEMRLAEQEGLVASLAWVIMPDHLHWLLRLGDADLAGLMKRLKGRSARRINRYLGLGGLFWQAGYHDRAVRREEDLRVVARYIIANPIRAGMVERVGDYPLWDAIWL